MEVIWIVVEEWVEGGDERDWDVGLGRLDGVEVGLWLGYGVGLFIMDVVG